jgi:2-polyprenyl-3-methyl-5-hydroxy-6-metoxy-1,4-benzoquinol methylase
MTASNRLEREKNFHDNRYGGDDSDRKSVEKYYMANIHMEERYIDIVSKLCIGKKLLEYGCGSGNNSNKWLKLGAKVTGIDISEEGIKKAKKSNCNSKYNADYYVMDAENTEFNKNSFDIVVGSGILHHLDLKKCYQELSRICKDNGHIVFQEPLGHNPFINFFRRLTPIMRTEDEHPMKSKNIKLLKNYFNNVEIEYFTLFTLLSVPFRKMYFFKFICNLLRSIDKVVLYVPFFGKYAWFSIIYASDPKNDY